MRMPSDIKELLVRAFYWIDSINDYAEWNGRNFVDMDGKQG